MIKVFPAILCFLLFSGCLVQKHPEPSVEITLVPSMGPGGTSRLETIKGVVVNFRPEYKLVLYARSEIWFVQPFIDQPFTSVNSDLTRESPTHLGTEYAALLVTPDYIPASKMSNLPEKGGGVIAITVVKGASTFWQSAWFN